MTQVTIINADVMDWANEYSGLPFMALMSDPPYHLVSINKRFGGSNSAPAKFGKDGAFQRASKGFLGATWDGTDESGQGIAFKPETWAALCQHLYPGAFGFSYASSRGWHRLAVAIEDAGNIIQPAIWIYGYSVGFPKSTQISSQLDKRAGVKGKRIENHPYANRGTAQSNDGVNLSGSPERDNYFEPATPLAKAWQNHRYGGQILSPSAEPIICFQKPYDGRPLDNIVATGVGSLNVGLGRIGNTHPSRETIDNGNGLFGLGGGKIGGNIEGGRWPKNLLLSHAQDCLHINGSWQCAPECVVRQMGEEYGEHRAAYGNQESAVKNAGNPVNHHSEWWPSYGKKSGLSYSDEGNVTRYFYQPHFSYEVFEQLSRGKQVLYVVKPGDAEREAGLNGHEKTTRNRVNSGGLENEPRFAPVTKANNHPTLKSIAASKYLAGLLLPPKEYAPRRILIPFCGSGSEVIGAMLAGWEEIIAIEQNRHYAKIAGLRTCWWKSKMEECGGDVEKIIDIWQKEEQAREDGQLRLFE